VNRRCARPGLTIVFAAAAVSRHLQDHSGVSIRKIVSTLRSVRSATITVDGVRLTLEPEVSHPPVSCSLRWGAKVTKPGGMTQV
jgi:hypothetical protein